MFIAIINKAAFVIEREERKKIKRKNYLWISISLEFSLKRGDLLNFSLTRNTQPINLTAIR